VHDHEALQPVEIGTAVLCHDSELEEYRRQCPVTGDLENPLAMLDRVGADLKPSPE
jgi:hypothetical protein